MPSRGFDKLELGGVVDNNGCFVPFSGWMQGCENKYTYDKDEVQVVHNEVIFLGTLNNAWGHALTDNFRHGWMFFVEKYRELLATKRIIYVTVDNKPLSKVANELYQLAGVDVSRAEHITQITKYDKVYVPSDCIINVEYGFLWSDAYKDIINRIKSSVMKVPSKDWPKKIYFTRTMLPQSTRDIGEPLLENFFRRCGYSIIAPERHSVVEQIQMLMNCDEFVGTEGSVSHGTVFCKSGTNVVLLMKTPTFNRYQMMSNQIADVNVTYIDVQNSFRVKPSMWEGPFFIYKSNYLYEYAKMKKHESPQWKNFYYWAYRIPLLARIEHKLRLLLNPNNVK